jgi:hypothetical protein
MLLYLQHRLAGEEIIIEDLFTDYTILSVQGPHAERLIIEAASMIEHSSKDLPHCKPRFTAPILQKKRFSSKLAKTNG